MAERPEDLNLPNAVVTRIIKDAIPEGVSVSKEARLAISKAASVFVLYATSCSNNFALKNKRKTINAQDVLSAMEDMEFEQFIEPLQQCQEAFRAEKLEKKKEKTPKPAPAAPQTEEDGDNDVEEVSGDEQSASRKKESKRQDDDEENEDYIITVNNDRDSNSSPEVLDTGD
uniref:DNA polymerase epsilon subunit 3 n=1 Tax=Arion vulgaris TaxID=1028688 RepID=A0A0B6Z7R3_9EUPU